MARSPKKVKVRRSRGSRWTTKAPKPLVKRRYVFDPPCQRCGSENVASLQIHEDEAESLSEGQLAEHEAGVWGTRACHDCGYQWIFENELPKMDAGELYELLQKQDRGQTAQGHGREAEACFRKWCGSEGYLYAKCSHLNLLMVGAKLEGDRAYWRKLKKIFTMLPRKIVIELRAFIESTGRSARYGNVSGMPDYIVIGGRKRRPCCLVEVKAHGKLKLGRDQVEAFGYFTRRGIKTRIWDAGIRTFREVSCT